MKRIETEEEYYKSPNLCLNCGSVIQVENGKVYKTRIKKFCNSSCFSFYNHKTNPKMKPKGRKSVCTLCKIEIELKRTVNGGYIVRKYCDKCLHNLKSERLKSSNGCKKHYIVKTTTKGDLISKFGKTERYRSVISYVARENYSMAKLDKSCRLCGYTHHIQICHIKSISSFDNSATIEEISNISNLVALCPNHHWEFDHGILSLESIVGSPSLVKAIL